MDKSNVREDRQKPIVKSPTAKDSAQYNMNHKRRGSAIIFNNENFHRYDKLNQQADVKNLKSVFKLLGFEQNSIIEHHDFTKDEIEHEVQRLSAENYEDCDCLFIVILTHGGERDNLAAKDSVYNLDEIINEFKEDRCRTLAGKPKIFLIDACKGSNIDKGVTVELQAGGSLAYDSSGESFSLPSSANFFIGFSSYKGDVSYGCDAGSPFISTFCEIMRENYTTTEFKQIMQMVARKVAIDFETETGEKQMPMIHSTLIRDIYFQPKDDK